MMRSLLLIPLVVIVVAAGAVALCSGIGAQTQTKAVVLAAVSCLAAGELAIVPLVLSKGGNQATISQAALLGTIIHLFVSIAIAGIVIFAKLGAGQTYLYWLAGFYWITLLV